MSCPGLLDGAAAPSSTSHFAQRLRSIGAGTGMAVRLLWFSVQVGCVSVLLVIGAVVPWHWYWRYRNAVFCLLVVVL